MYPIVLLLVKSALHQNVDHQIAVCQTVDFQIVDIGRNFDKTNFCTTPNTTAEGT
jgi:hypothetical protein